MSDIPRTTRGQTAGGQFATMNRPESEISLIRPLSEFDTKRLERALNRATNGVGRPIATEARAKLVAVATNPSATNWDEAYATIIRASRATTLWQALITHTDFSVMSKPSGGEWVATPSREDVLHALDLGTREDS